MLFKISNSFFYTQKVAYFVFKGSSSPVKSSNFNPLNPKLLTLYRRPNLIKIWPTYAVPPTTTLYPCSTYTCGSSPTIFQPVEKLIPLTTTSQSGPDQSPLYFKLTYALPNQGPLIADPSIFPERERVGFALLSGVNGLLMKRTMYVNKECTFFGRSSSLYVTNNMFRYTCTYNSAVWVLNWKKKKDD